MKDKLEKELKKVQDEMERSEGKDLSYLEGWEMALLWVLRQERKNGNV